MNVDVRCSFFSVNLPQSIRCKNNLALMGKGSRPGALCLHYKLSSSPTRSGLLFLLGQAMRVSVAAEASRVFLMHKGAVGSGMMT